MEWALNPTGVVGSPITFMLLLLLKITLFNFVRFWSQIVVWLMLGGSGVEIHIKVLNPLSILGT